MWRRVLPPVLLVLSGVAMIGVGWMGFTAPADLMAPLDVDLDGPSAFNEVRAMYGGMHVGLGLFLIATGLRPALRTIGLWATLCMMGGLVVGRLASFVVDGAPGDFVVRLIIPEAVAALLAAVLLSGGGRGRAASAARF